MFRTMALSPSSGTDVSFLAGCGTRTLSAHKIDANTTIKTASVVRVTGYKSRGPGFDSLRYQIF
jgi:hypothetical protein